MTDRASCNAPTMQNDLLDTVLVKNVKPGANASQNGKNITHDGDDQPKCPIDHKTRETWLRQARAMPPRETASLQQSKSVSTPPLTTNLSASSSSWSWPTWSLGMPSLFNQRTTTTPSQSQQQQPQPKPDRHHLSQTPHLPTSRVVSSIPRSINPGPSQCPSSSPCPAGGKTPANNESETGSDAASGHWVYPSEAQFFAALQRKGYSSAQAQDMRTVVPIHNAVNERTWREILEWERPYTGNITKTAAAQAQGEGVGSGSTTTPKLHSFAGNSERMTPRARIKALLGYTPPFDRHDWTVDRGDGKRVEYVIDFYAGRQTQTQQYRRGSGAREQGQGQQLSFYLDVRPKLNTWEGIKMRVMKGVGFV